MIKPFYQIDLKILALISAVVLWFIVITVENTVYKFPEKIDVAIINLGKNLNLEEALPSVDVILRVDKEDLEKITKNDLEVYVDLSDIEAGEQTVKIEASSKSVQAQVLKVEPDEVTLKISPIIEKEVEVRIIVEGEVAEGYKIESSEGETDKVIIAGVQHIIDEIEYVEAKLILDETQTENIKQTVILAIPESQGFLPDLVTITPEEMVVSAEITSSTQQKQVTVIPKFINENDRSAFKDMITVTPENINVEGDESSLSQISSIETEAIEISSLIKNRSVEIGLSLPDGISLVDPEQKIEIKIIERDLGTEPTI